MEKNNTRTRVIGVLIFLILIVLFLRNPSKENHKYCEKDDDCQISLCPCSDFQSFNKNFHRECGDSIKSCQGDPTFQRTAVCVENQCEISPDPKIIIFRSELTLQRERSAVVTIGIRNDKSKDLNYDFSINVLNTNSNASKLVDVESWFTPVEGGTLNSNERRVFNYRITVPSNTNLGVYSFEFIVRDKDECEKSQNSESKGCVYATENFIIEVTR